MFQSIAKSLIFALLLLFILYLKNEYSYFFSSNTSGLISVPKYGEFLFIGSSMTRQSYDTRLLNGTKRNVYLLAYNGNQPCMILEQMRFLKLNGNSWKKYIIEFYPQTSEANPSISDLRIFLDSDLDLKLKYINTLKFGKEITFAEYYELFVTSNIELITTFLISRPLIDSLSYNGGYVGKVETGSDAVFLEKASSLISPLTGEVNSYQRQCWIDIFKFAKEENLSLEIWESPKYESILSHPNYIQIRNQMLLLAKENGIKNASFPFETSDPSNFRDPIHLSSKGRDIFTREVMKRF